VISAAVATAVAAMRCLRFTVLLANRAGSPQSESVSSLTMLADSRVHERYRFELPVGYAVPVSPV